MLISAFLLIFAAPQIAKTTSAVSDVPATTVSSQRTDSSASADMPSVPQPKVKTDVGGSLDSNSAPLLSSAGAPAPLALPAGEMIFPRSAGAPVSPVKPVLGRNYETRPPRKIKMWYALAFMGHGAAVFDAWSTRRAISGNYGKEANPFLRPFAHNNSMYAATQVSPAIMNYLGRRLMVSQHRWVRKMWWLPQTAGTAVSFAAGVHNYGVVP